MHLADPCFTPKCLSNSPRHPLPDPEDKKKQPSQAIALLADQLFLAERQPKEYWILLSVTVNIHVICATQPVRYIRFNYPLPSLHQFIK
jgi:hypothetical protein